MNAATNNETTLVVDNETTLVANNETTLVVVGYVIVIKPRESPTYEVLGYGRSSDPAPDELLRDRSASLFDSKAQAWAEIKKIKADPEKEWAWGFVFGTLEITRRVAAK